MAPTAGRDDALAVLARERGGALFGYALLAAGDRSAAEDLVPDALVKVFSRVRQGFTPDDAERYVRRAILTIHLDAHRRSTRWRAVRHLLGGTDVADDDGPRAAEATDVHAALRTLGPRHRACGTDFLTTLDPDGSARVHAEGQPLDLAVAVGEAPDVTAILENTGNQTADPLVVDVAEGPVLLAIEETGVVVGFARLDRPPGPVEVSAGDSVSHTGFGPLYRCPGVGRVATHPYLDQGQYTVYVGQLFSDRGYSLPLSVWERVGGLVATDSPGANPQEIEFTYTDPTRDHTFLDEDVVLARDGVVVADEFVGGWGGAQLGTWTDGDTRSTAFTTFHDCAAEEDYTDYDPAGRYTLLGYTVYGYEDEWGLYNGFVATLGPVDVDFGERG